MAYDPMVAKLCTWGSDRTQAIQRMHRALDETVVLGITTNIALHHRVLKNESFRAGRYDTGLLNDALNPAPRDGASAEHAALAAAAISRLESDRTRAAQANLTVPIPAVGTADCAEP